MSDEILAPPPTLFPSTLMVETSEPPGPPEPLPPKGFPVMMIPPPTSVPDENGKSDPINIPLVIYNILSGKVLGNFRLSVPTIAAYLERNVPFIFYPTQVDPKLEYVVMGEVVPRPENPTTLNGLLLSNIPIDSFEPAKISITSRGNTQEYDITGQTEVELDFPNPGQYVIELTGFPYKTTFFTVNT